MLLVHIQSLKAELTVLNLHVNLLNEIGLKNDCWSGVSVYTNRSNWHSSILLLLLLSDLDHATGRPKLDSAELRALAVQSNVVRISICRPACDDECDELHRWDQDDCDQDQVDQLAAAWSVVLAV